MVARLGDDSTPESTAAMVTAAVSGIARGTPPRAVRAVASPLHAGPGDVPLDIAIMLSLFLFVLVFFIPAHLLENPLRHARGIRPHDLHG